MEQGFDHKERRLREALRDLERERLQILRERVQKMGVAIGIGLPSVLSALYEKDNITQRELSENCARDTATLSRALDRLEESGWIERRQDPDSRRCFRVVLTESGRGVAKGVREAYAEIDKTMFEGFAEEELDRLYAALGKIRSNLNSKMDER